MKRNYLCLLSALVVALLFDKAYSFEIVYPKSNDVVINSESTFFIGNENPETELKINSEPVNIHSSGGFLHPVKLEFGENSFVIDNGIDEPITYTVTRDPIPCGKTDVAEILYDEPLVYLTVENAILRATPVDFGVNRLQHLQSGIPLKVVGEVGDFYKIQLSRDEFVWISKNDVRQFNEKAYSQVKINNFIYEENSDKRVFTLKLSGKAPYILSEYNGLDLVVYNIKDYPEGKYEFHINPIGKLFGYKAYFKNSNELVIEVKNYPKINKEHPLKNIHITLDPGHGGSEYGAIGCLGDKEKDINLLIAQKLQSVLTEAGADVFLTRNDDSYVSLSDRVKLSKDYNSDIFISIHNNALPDSQAFSGRSGASVFYYYPQSRALGDKILNELVSIGLKNDKVRRESFAVVRNTESPAILIEVGYIIDPDDNSKLIDEDFQIKASEAIKQGLENYFNDL